jgi:hypothetical protein
MKILALLGACAAAWATMRRTARPSCGSRPMRRKRLFGVAQERFVADDRALLERNDGLKRHLQRTHGQVEARFECGAVAQCEGVGRDQQERFATQLGELVKAQRARDGVDQHTRIHRLGKVAKGAVLHRRDRRLQAGRAGDHQYGYVEIARTQRTQERDAVELGHGHVGDDHVVRALRGQNQRLFAVCGRVHLVATLLDQCSEYVAYRGLVIHQ